MGSTPATDDPDPDPESGRPHRSDPTLGRVAVIGSSNVDLVARCERLPGPGETVLGTEFLEAPGGKGLNQAVAAARSGAHTAFVSMVGNDDAARIVLDVLASDGISQETVGRCSSPTGRALIGVDASGENSIIVVPGANAELRADHITEHGPAIAAARVVLAQLEVSTAVVQAAFEVARATDVITVLNPAPAADLPRELLTLIDVCVPNEHEVELLGGVEGLRKAGVRAVVVTEGARGCRVVDDLGERRVASLPVTPVDTTGAGDSFCGSLAARLAAGDTLDAAVRWAVVAGALATTSPGAVPAVPRAEAIRARLGDLA